jgi:hypothetical protein
LQELLVYFYDCKKKEKEKLSQCVIATRGNVRLQKNEPDFVCVVRKRN